MSTSRQNIQQHVQLQFGNVAANYRTSAVHAAGADLQQMLVSARISPDSLVLDAGCGAGHTAMAFAPRAREVIAYDLTPSMLEQVEQLADERGVKNVSTQEGDVENLPFEDASFDLVVTRYSSHHWLHPEKALKEFRRVLKPDGQFIVSDIMASDNYAEDTFLQTLELLRDPSHVRDYSIAEWGRFLSDAQFDPKVVFTHQLSLHFDTWLKRIATPQQNAAMIKTLFNVISEDIKQSFAIPETITDNDFYFVIPGAVITG